MVIDKFSAITAVLTRQVHQCDAFRQRQRELNSQPIVIRRNRIELPFCGTTSTAQFGGAKSYLHESDMAKFFKSRD